MLPARRSPVTEDAEKRLRAAVVKSIEEFQVALGDITRGYDFPQLTSPVRHLYVGGSDRAGFGYGTAQNSGRGNGGHDALGISSEETITPIAKPPGPGRVLIGRHGNNGRVTSPEDGESVDYRRGNHHQRGSPGHSYRRGPNRPPGSPAFAARREFGSPALRSGRLPDIDEHRMHHHVATPSSSMTRFSGSSQTGWEDDCQQHPDWFQQRLDHLGHGPMASQPCAPEHQRSPDISLLNRTTPPSTHNSPGLTVRNAHKNPSPSGLLLQNPANLVPPNLVPPPTPPPNQGFGTDDMAETPPPTTLQSSKNPLGEDMPARPRPVAAQSAPAVPMEASRASSPARGAIPSTASLPVTKNRASERGNRLQRRSKNASVSGSPGPVIAPPGHLEPNNPHGYPAPPPFRKSPPQNWQDQEADSPEHNWRNPNRRAAFGSVDPRRAWRASPLGSPVGLVPGPANTGASTRLTVNTGGISSTADVINRPPSMAATSTATSPTTPFTPMSGMSPTEAEHATGMCPAKPTVIHETMPVQIVRGQFAYFDHASMPDHDLVPAGGFGGVVDHGVMDAEQAEVALRDDSRLTVMIDRGFDVSFGAEKKERKG
ncbi:hypothetical protein OQA88_2010 [Cercophora sp. LCS_1]